MLSASGKCWGLSQPLEGVGTVSRLKTWWQFYTHKTMRDFTMVKKTAITRALAVMMITGIVAVASLAGCQSLGQRDMGRLVPDFYRVAIPPVGETASNTLKTHDMTVRYQCRRAGDYLKIWGSGDIRYQTINELVYHLYFLDERGEVIGIHNFYSYLDHSDFIELTLEKRQIHRDFTIPPGAVAFAIGYDGQTGRMPGEDPISFSHNPFH
jgi:hypothetical protein